MKTSDDGIALIKKHEGLRLIPYDDVAGLKTIGYGHLIKHGEEFWEITEEEAEAILRKDLCDAEQCIERAVKVALKHEQFDALVSFVFNLGCGAFMQSTILKLINRGDLDKADDQFLRWVYAGGRKVKGLENRRLAEMLMFNGFGKEIDRLS